MRLRQWLRHECRIKCCLHQKGCSHWSFSLSINLRKTLITIFPEPKVTSSNRYFCPTNSPKNSLFTITNDKENSKSSHQEVGEISKTCNRLVNASLAYADFRLSFRLAQSSCSSSSLDQVSKCRWEFNSHKTEENQVIPSWLYLSTSSNWLKVKTNK